MTTTSRAVCPNRISIKGKVPARCEGCHRLFWIRPEMVRDPDWWHCGECSGEGEVTTNRDRVAGELNEWWIH